MAFTTSEKVKILKYLGWPASTLDPNSLSYSKIISDRLLTTIPEGETEAREYIERIMELDNQLKAAVSQSGVKRIDDIEFFGAEDGGNKTSELRKERKRLVRELASLLDIAIGPGAYGSAMGNVCV